MSTTYMKKESNNVIKNRKNYLLSLRPILIKTLLAVVISVGIFSLFLISQKQNPVVVMKALVNVFVNNKYNRGEILVTMTPVILTGIAALIPMKVGLVNCGGEGQLIIGALCANIIAVSIGDGMTSIIGILLMLGAGALGGMIWGAIPLACKMKLNMNETLTTLLMNYVALRFVAYMVFGPVKDPNGNNYPMTAKIPDAFRIPAYDGMRANFFIIIVLVIAVLLYFFFKYSELGFKMTAIGENERAARFGGMNVIKIQSYSFLISAAIAGVAGGIIMGSIEFQMRELTGSGLGFMGLLSAGIVNNNPILLIGSTFILSALKASGTTLEMSTGLRASASTIFMSIILLTIFGLGRSKRDQ